MQEAFLQSIIFINIRAADEERDHLIENCSAALKISNNRQGRDARVIKQEGGVAASQPVTVPGVIFFPPVPLSVF